MIRGEISSLARKDIESIISGSRDKILACLELLEGLSKAGLMGGVYWEVIDQKYQELTFRKETYGENVAPYRRRYSDIFKLPDQGVGHFNTYDKRPAITAFSLGGACA
jgi:hypothetical protein